MTLAKKYSGFWNSFNTTYSYDGADELTSIKDTYGNEFNFSYDLAGNLISQVGGEVKWKINIFYLYFSY